MIFAGLLKGRPPEIYRTLIPKQSSIYSYIRQPDFRESFYCTVPTSLEIDASLAFKHFVDSPPPVIQFLLKVRDTLFRPFGLQTSEHPSPIDFIEPPVARETSTVSDMFISFKSKEEVIWGLQDKHLDFVISLICLPKPAHEVKESLHEYEIWVSSAIRYHNIWGRLYFFSVNLIHVFVLKTMILTMKKRISI